MSKFIVRKNVGGILIEAGNWIIIDNEMIVTDRGSGLNLGKCEINKYISLLMVFVIVNDNLHRKVLPSLSIFIYITIIMISMSLWEILSNKMKSLSIWWALLLNFKNKWICSISKQFQTEINYLQNLKIKQTISKVITSYKNLPGWKSIIVI